MPRTKSTGILTTISTSSSDDTHHALDGLIRRNPRDLSGICCGFLLDSPFYYRRTDLKNISTHYEGDGSMPLPRTWRGIAPMLGHQWSGVPLPAYPSESSKRHDLYCCQGEYQKPLESDNRDSRPCRYPAPHKGGYAPRCTADGIFVCQLGPLESFYDQNGSRLVWENISSAFAELFKDPWSSLWA